MQAVLQLNRFLMTKNNKSTRSSYRRTVNLFLEYCQLLGYGNKDELDFLSLIPIMSSDQEVICIMPIDQQLIEDFLIYRHESGDTVSTRCDHLRHLKSFFNYLIGQKWLNYNPCELIPPIRKPKSRETVYLDQGESLLLLYAAATSDFPERNFALIKSFLTTGMRPKEVRLMQKADLDCINKFIHICRWQKTGRISTVPLYDQLYLDIQAYLNCERRRIYAAPEVFLYEDEPFTEAQLLDLVKSLCQRVGINKPFTPKGFRHSYATLLFQNGLDIIYIKELMNHKQLKTTQIYTHGFTSNKHDPRLWPYANLISKVLQREIHMIRNPVKQR
ncbi:MAG: tyrosine-type recombinase/integrase [Syntrophomonas sp.]